MLRAYSEGEFPLGFSAEKLLRFAAAKKSSDKQPHFFEGALPVQTHFQISTQAIFFWCKEMDSLFTILLGGVNISLGTAIIGLKDCCPMKVKLS